MAFSGFCGNKIVVLEPVTTKSIKQERTTSNAPSTRRPSSPSSASSARRGNAIEEGNVRAEEGQWAKLRTVVELADEVRG
jgi:hypothetical protein